MKTKYLVILIVFAVFLFVTACGKKQEGTSENSNVEKQNEIVDENLANDEDDEIKEETSILSGTYKVPLQNIYIDTPAFNKIESAYSELFMVNDSRYVAFTCLYEESGTNAENAFKTTFDNLKDYLRGYHQVNFLNEVEAKSIEVNSISTYCITGTVNCGTEDIYDAYIYGYSFVFQGYPCSIIGIVEDKAQLQTDINEITEIVDAMMESVRSEQ